MIGKRRCLFPVLVVLTLFFAMCQTGYSHPSLGISGGNVYQTIQQGNLETFKVGRVYNTGNITLKILAYWIQKYGNTTLPVVVDPPSMRLSPEENHVLYVQVKEDAKPGYYNGTVEIEATPLEELPGNPIVPGGSLNVEVTVLASSMEPPPQNQTKPENKTELPEPVITRNPPFPYAPLVTATLIICVGVTLLVYFKKVRKPTEK